jgi:SagB-type dehydrogenase family enzyme
MPRSHQVDLAHLYHTVSSNNRLVTVETEVERDRQPLKFRTYAGSPRVVLPGRDYDLPVTLGEALATRKSIRDYQLRPLELATLGRLLYASYGVRGYRNVDGRWFGERAVPSGGGLYPLELYVAAQAVEHLPDGIYHYDAKDHQLALRCAGVYHAALADMTIGQDMIREANLVVMISGIFQRTMWKYGQRGYRFVLLEAGHLGQNLYLVAAALGLGPVAIGGFFDDEVHDFIRLPSDEQIIYMMCIGFRQLSRDKDESGDMALSNYR